MLSIQGSAVTFSDLKIFGGVCGISVFETWKDRHKVIPGHEVDAEIGPHHTSCGSMGNAGLSLLL